MTETEMWLLPCPRRTNQGPQGQCPALSQASESWWEAQSQNQLQCPQTRRQEETQVNAVSMQWGGLANSQCHRDQLLHPLVWRPSLGLLPLVTQLTARHKDVLRNIQELASLILGIQALISKSRCFRKGKSPSLAAQGCSIVLCLKAVMLILSSGSK